MKPFKKLNQTGVAHLAALAVVVVGLAAVGTYELVKSHAQVPPPDPYTPSWHTIQTNTGTWTVQPQKNVVVSAAARTLYSGYTYRYCASIKANWTYNAGITTLLNSTYSGSGINLYTYVQYIYNNYAPFCTTASKATATHSVSPVIWDYCGCSTQVQPNTPSITANSIKWQRYY